MTCRALLPEWFVDHDGNLLFRNQWEMAFFAGNFFVSAVELESAVAIMDKQEPTPQCRLMALFAVHLVFFPKLSAMNILMAVNTAKRQRPVTNETFGQ
jgi:hypothetical protein